MIVSKRHAMPLDFCLPTSSILPRRARVFWTFSMPVFNVQSLRIKQMPSASLYTVELLRLARVFWTFSRPVFNAQFLTTKQMPSASPYTVELLRLARVFLTFSRPVFNAQFLMTKQMRSANPHTMELGQVQIKLPLSKLFATIPCAWFL